MSAPYCRVQASGVSIPSVQVKRRYDRTIGDRIILGEVGIRYVARAEAAGEAGRKNGPKRTRRPLRTKSSLDDTTEGFVAAFGCAEHFVGLHVDGNSLHSHGRYPSSTPACTYALHASSAKPIPHFVALEIAREPVAHAPGPTMFPRKGESWNRANRRRV